MKDGFISEDVAVMKRSLRSSRSGPVVARTKKDFTCTVIL